MAEKHEGTTIGGGANLRLSITIFAAKMPMPWQLLMTMSHGDLPNLRMNLSTMSRPQNTAHGQKTLKRARRRSAMLRYATIQCDQ